MSKCLCGSNDATQHHLSCLYRLVVKKSAHIPHPGYHNHEIAHMSTSTIIWQSILMRMPAFTLSSLQVLVFFAWAALMIQCTQFQRIVIILIHGGRLNIKMPSYSIGIPMLKIRRSRDRLIFNMGIPIPGKDGLYIETRGIDTLWDPTLRRLGARYWHGSMCVIVVIMNNNRS